MAETENPKFDSQRMRIIFSGYGFPSQRISNSLILVMISGLNGWVINPQLYLSNLVNNLYIVTASGTVIDGSYLRLR